MDAPYPADELTILRKFVDRLESVNPNYTFAEHVDRQPFRRQEDVERIADGLKKARLLN